VGQRCLWHEDVNSTYISGLASPDNDTYYFKAGLRERWHPLGHTVLYGEYGNHDDALAPGLTATGATGSEFTRYGLGVVQEIDAAAMSLWISYRHLSFDDNVGAILGPAVVGASGFEDFQYIKGGALINF
jgi:hypothetical protein